MWFKSTSLTTCRSCSHLHGHQLANPDGNHAKLSPKKDRVRIRKDEEKACGGRDDRRRRRGWLVAFRGVIRDLVLGLAKSLEQILLVGRFLFVLW